MVADAMHVGLFLFFKKKARSEKKYEKQRKKNTI